MMHFRNLITKAFRVLAAAAVGVSALAYLPEPTVADAAAWRGLTGEEMVAKMGVGWNLGNTLDSTGDWLKGKNVNGYETGWGNPKTTKAMIDAVKKQGFSGIRIPVTWTDHFNKSTGKIDSAWLARVKEVVNYGIDNDMVVILNTHHEDWINVINSGYSNTNSILTKLWKSVAEAFKNYDQHLIFESLNEPRQGDDWTGKNEYYNNVNKLNANFVKTVRATGGNNKTRCLLIPGYCASSSDNIMASITVPNDRNVIVSVHAYTPYELALRPDSTKKSLDSSGRAEIDALFSNINKHFLSKDIPVILGECSVSYRSNHDGRTEWADYYISQAKQYGIPCFIWDNNQYTTSNNGEQHGYLNRKTLKWYDQTMVDTIVNAWKNTPSGIPDKSGEKVLFSGNSSSSGWGQAVALDNFDFSLLTSGKKLTVTYSSSKKPQIIIQDNSYHVWSVNDPASYNGTTATFDVSKIIKNYASDYQSYYAKKPSDAFGNAIKLYVGDTGANLSVTKLELSASGSSSKTQLSKLSVNGISGTYKYTGGAIRPNVTIKNGSKALTQGRDYTVTYTDNVAKGTAQVVLTGKGNYTGTITKSFSITTSGSGNTNPPATTTKKQTTTKSDVKTTRKSGAVGGNITSDVHGNDTTVTTQPAEQSGNPSGTVTDKTGTGSTTFGKSGNAGTDALSGTENSSGTDSLTTMQSNDDTQNSAKEANTDEKSTVPVAAIAAVVVILLLAAGAVMFFLKRRK